MKFTLNIDSQPIKANLDTMEAMSWKFRLQKLFPKSTIKTERISPEVLSENFHPNLRGMDNEHKKATY